MNKINRLTVGVIGCGHWGPNHIRVFTENDRSTVTACADTNVDRLEKIRNRFPRLNAVSDHRILLDDPSIDAVVIATPTRTHAKLGTEAMQAGKHVLLEKPMCATTDEATSLEQWAQRTRRVLMVGHVFLYNHGIRKLRSLIADGTLGRIQYLDAVRTNLGPVRGDVNALFDLGTHDLSIFNYLLDATPISVSAQGSCITQPTIEDVCFATLRYPSGTIAHIHVSWLNPRKVRTLTAVGSRKMAHWDDIHPEETLRVYDKGLDEPPYYNSFGEFQYALRSADVHLPAIRRCEPLLEQARAFTDWVLDDTPCGPGINDGLAIVQALEAATASLNSGGTLVPIVSSADGTPRSMPRNAVEKPAAPLPSYRRNRRPASA